jgi:hypothetical protein
VVLAVFSIAGCNRERLTQVNLEGQSTPQFTFSGSGNLNEFSVYVVSPSDLTIGRTVESLSTESFFTQPPLWRVEVQTDVLHARTVGNIGRLTYGVLPQGYRQTIPADGTVPPSISSGKQYFFECSTVNAPGARGFFQVIDGKTVRAQVNLPCLQSRNGKEITVPCG